MTTPTLPGNPPVAPPQKPSETKKSGSWDWLAKNMNYFPYFRMVSYQFEATYDYIYQQLAGKKSMEALATRFTEATKKFVGNHAEPGSILRKAMGIMPFVRDVEDVRPRNESGRPNMYFGQKPPESDQRRGTITEKNFTSLRDPKVRSVLFARNLLNVAEAVVFSIVTTFSYMSDRRRLMSDFAKTVALETNKPTDQVTFRDIKKSDNPLVRVETGKFSMRYLVRYLTDLSFGWGIKTGILLKMSSYPYEFTGYRNATELEALRKSIQDVQEHELGVLGRGQLISNMIRVMQHTITKENKRALSADEVTGLRKDVLDPMADIIINKKADLADFVYVAGSRMGEARRLQETKERFGHWLALNGLTEASAKGTETLPETPPGKQWAKDGAPTTFADRTVDTSNTVLTR